MASRCAVVAGIGAGVVIGLVAGARRTERAYPNFLDASNASDVLVSGKNSFGLVGSVDLDDVEKLPEVAATTRMNVSLLFSGRLSDGRRVGPVDLFPVAPEGTSLGRTIEKWKILEGRRANPNVVDEATASFVLAQNLDLHVGDTIRLHFIKAETFPAVALKLLSSFGSRLSGAPGSQATRIDQLADGPEITFRIVGIEAAPDEFPPIPPDTAPPLHLTPAFTKQYVPGIMANQLTYVHLHRPAELTSFAQGRRTSRAGATRRLHHQPRHADSEGAALGRRRGERVATARGAHVARADLRARRRRCSGRRSTRRATTPHCARSA